MPVWSLSVCELLNPSCGECHLSLLHYKRHHSTALFPLLHLYWLTQDCYFFRAFKNNNLNITESNSGGGKCRKPVTCESSYFVFTVNMSFYLFSLPFDSL